MLNNNHVGMSSSLEWACKVLNSVCITRGKILNVSCCWLIHQQCLASELGASQGLQSTWEGCKSRRVLSTPGACPGAASLWNNGTSCVWATDTSGSAGGFWGRAKWQPWKGTSVQRVCVSDSHGEICVTALLAVPLLTLYWGVPLLLVTKSVLLDCR